jgi:hypothetical protein
MDTIQFVDYRMKNRRDDAQVADEECSKASRSEWPSARGAGHQAQKKQAYESDAPHDLMHRLVAVSPDGRWAAVALDTKVVVCTTCDPPPVSRMLPCCRREIVALGK